ncbi:hypothetical protein M0R89_14225 [Halorussus limi]|uniref:Uncharacterized protein n=1 Tax=Halorussus limi TaxID=2938695 RepID=A0A8U0HRV1_9EURY|nr:hypothetical protein [Halorussus limi]UPV73690.1 hypothetical protein M0R89_14225 [Halorussus limi]
MPTRRRLLATLPCVALAGCLGSAPDAGGTGQTSDETNGTGRTTTADEATTTPSLPDDLTRRNGETVVDFPAMTDGEVSVDSEDGITTLAFSGPTDATFELAAAAGGEVVTDGPPTASKTLTPADEPRAFVAPVYRDGGFEFRVYANTAFREMGDLHVWAGPGGTVAGDAAVSRPAEFDSRTDAVGRTTVSGADVDGAEDGAPLSVGVFDAPLDAVRSGDAADVRGVALQSGESLRRTPAAPKVALAYEFADESVTITHEGGDTLSGPTLSVEVGGEATDAAFPDEVSAGESVTADLSGVESGTTVRVVWTAPEGDFSAVLGRATVP